MELELKVNINDLPLEALILIAASKRKVSVTVSDETCLSAKNSVLFSSNISAMRYVANTDTSYKWMGASALERCEINHWITYSFGPLSSKDNFEESLTYLDRIIAPVTFLVGDKCSLADIAVWSKLFNLPNWIDLLQSNRTPINVTRWYSFIASLDYVKEAVKQIGSLTNNFPVQNVKKEDKVSNPAHQETGRKDEGKFVDLPGAEMGKVVVRFPPEASGYLHIGHAKAALLNQYYKEAFNGQLIMRFDDTNPAKEKEDFERVILEDLKFLNINYDKFSRTSDYFEVMLDMCEKLIKEGKAYVDDTNAEEMKKEREKKICSKNRDNSVEKNMSMWNEMRNGTAKGQMCCVRAKIDMSSLNGCMRDPTIYRCKNESHPQTGNRYKVYPTYDFACPIVDSLEGVTHCLRTMEYHDRDEQFYWFIDVLGLRKPHIWEYSRLNMTNTVLSKRKLTWFVENGYVDGWDDPRMPTVRGVLRRGMTVEGLKQFIIAQGSSRSVVVMEWDKIWAFNKKVIDPVAPRYTAVDALKKVTVEVQCAMESMQVPKHPKNKEVGDKTIWVAPTLIVDEADAVEFKVNENVTFINWGNITIKDIVRKDNKIVKVVATSNLEDKNYKKTMKITWLALTLMEPLIPVVCLYFDHIISKAILGKDEDFKQFIDHTTMFKAEMLGEPALASVKKSEIIQLQRKGFFFCDQEYSPPSACTFKANPLVLIYIPDGHSKGLPSGLVAEDKKVVRSTKENWAEYIKEFIQQEEIVSNMLSTNKESAELDVKIKELVSLKRNCDFIGMQGWIPSCETENGEGKSENSNNILSQIAVLGHKIRKLKGDKASKNLIKETIKKQTELKASYTAVTGQPWSSKQSSTVSNSTKGCSEDTQGSKLDSTTLSLKITEVGNKVRKLKTDKAGKAIIDQEVQYLLKLKADFKSLTGTDWKPDSSISDSPIVQENKKVDRTSLSLQITEVGNKIRKMKADKVEKAAIDKEVKCLLKLKADFKSLTGADWKPDSSPSEPFVVQKSELLDSTALSLKITDVGNKIRKMKADKVEKAAIDQEVKCLLKLKADFKSLTGADWKPDSPPNIGTDKTSLDVDELLKKISEVGNKIRALKSAKSDKNLIDEEVKVLLQLKGNYKKITGKDWTPELSVSKAKNEAKASGDNSGLSDKIKIQGDKIRQLKANKVEKSVIDAEVKILLALKSEFKTSTGKDWVPDSTEQNKKSIPEVVKKQTELNLDVTSLTNKIKDQGNLVRTMKANNGDKGQLNDAIGKLLSLKSEYKALTGQDFPSDGKAQGKKNKNSVEEANKKVQSPIKKAAKQENKPENETTLKKITRLGLEAKKEENLPDWYSQIIVKSELIEYYDISGCYILRPWSFAIWEAIKEFLDSKIKLLGVKNCYFPIFVSKAVLEKEKTHIADFAPEVAWVTKSGDSDLAEPIAVRPTSETVMYPAYAKWIQSYRDLPIKLNQWNNVVRWEFKHPQPFLRTREFLWQEGHTAFATYPEAEAEVYTVLDFYAAVYTDLLAIPVVKGRKTEKEKFAGGEFTLTVEAYISASGRAIQGGTSHHLGQNFSKMFEIIFEDPVTQEKKYVFQNSWGLTTRTIGVLIMVHADNQGLVLPPRVASIQVILIPCGITASLKQSDKDMLLDVCNKTCNLLKENGIRCELDDRDNYSPGWKFNHWELKGVPVRVEIGPKDMQQQQIVAVRRDTGQKAVIPCKRIVTEINSLLDTIQSDLLTKAYDELKQHMIVCKEWNIFCQQLDKKNIILSPFCGRIECEDKIKEESARNDGDVDANAPSMGAKSLCIPFEQPAQITGEDRCIHPSCNITPKFYCLFGRSY